jgi:membrane protease YdiL (CAAX protease family)
MIAALVRKRPLTAFFVTAYALSWATWIPMALAHQEVGFGKRPSHFPGLLGPMIAAMLVTLATDGRPGWKELTARMFRWRVGRRWIAVCAGSPLLFFAIAAAAGAATGKGWPSLDELGVFGGLPAVGPLGVWVLLVVVNGLGEETGWRGFALERLRRTHAPLPATLILAGLWAGWHLPLFFVLDSFRALGPALLPGFLFGMVCGAVVLTWLYERTQHSILMVALWHGTYNLTVATRAARGLVPAVVSTLIMVWAIALVAIELRARSRGPRAPRPR